MDTLTIVTHRGRTVRVGREPKRNKKDPPRITKHELFRHVCDKDTNGTVFSDNGLVLYDSPDLKVGEGRSERAIRYELGLPYDIGSVPGERMMCDLPELNEEIKDIFGPITKPSGNPQYYGSAKFSGGVTTYWRRTFLDIGRLYADEELPPSVWDALFKDEIGKGVLGSMPLPLQDMIAHRMKPNVTLVEYSAIILAAPDCFLRVPADEYDQAFEFTGMTRKEIKYELRWEYLIEKARSHERKRYVFRRRGNELVPLSGSVA